VTPLSDERFVVTWGDENTLSGSEFDTIDVLIFNPNGSLATATSFLAFNATAFTSKAPVGCGSRIRGFVVIWTQRPVAAVDAEVRFCLFDAAGANVLNSPTGVLIDGDGSINRDFHALELPEGAFAVAYADNAVAGGSGPDISQKHSTRMDPRHPASWASTTSLLEVRTRPRSRHWRMAASS
jgi:hypothetical protein